MAPQTALILFAGWFCVAPKRAIEAMEAHSHRGFAFGFFDRSDDSGLVLPAGQVSKATINLPIGLAADCSGTVTRRFRSCSRN